MTTEMIGRVCDSVRIELENRDLNRYINSILTAYVLRQPPDYEAGLALLLRIRGAQSLFAYLKPRLKKRSGS